MTFVAPSATNLAYAQFDWYEPFYTVDVGDFIDRIEVGEETYAEVAVGEIMDLNDDGYACGYYIDANDQSELQQPFVFSLVDGGSAELLPLGDFESGVALGLNPTTSPMFIIVGWVEDMNGQVGHEAAYWVWDSGWELNLIGDYVESEAQAVTEDGFITGSRYVSGDPYIFVFDADSEQVNFLSQDETVAYSIQDVSDWIVAGTRITTGPIQKAFYKADGVQGVILHSALPEYSIGNDYDESIAYATNSESDIVGYAIDNTGSPIYDPAYWWYDAGWDAMILSADYPDPVDAGMHDVTEPDGNGWINIVGDYDVSGTDLRGVFFVRIVQGDDQNPYWSYALDDTGEYGHASLALYPIAAREGDPPRSYTGNAINDRFWIGGSYSPEPPSSGPPTDFRPCLWIPNDVDNNGIADIAEILDDEATQSPTLDSNGNWLLDWAENLDLPAGQVGMRAGLHAPGFNGATSGNGTHMLAVENTQIARFPLKLRNIAAQQISIEDEMFSIENIVNGEEDPSTYELTCDSFYQSIRKWATVDDGGSPQQREIVITVTNPFIDGNGEPLPYDEVLTPADEDWESALDILRVFSYRFARCIDYVQAGNESLKGASEWAIYENQNYTPLFCLEDEDYFDLLDDGVYWARAQAEAVRIGSALSGRPLRVIAPGFPLGVINTGAEGDPDREGDFENCGPINCDDPDIAFCDGNENKSALGMYEIGRIVFDDRLYFDLHLHYKYLVQALGDDDTIEGTLDHMMNPNLAAWGSGGEYLPASKVILEFGPRGDAEHEEWGGFLTEMGTFFSCGTPSFDTWDEMIKSDDGLNLGWELTQYDDLIFGDGFQMGYLLDLIELDGYTAVCYGPCGQGDDNGPSYLIAALRASKLKDCNPLRICDQSDLFTPVLRYATSYGATCAGDLTPGNDDFETLIYDFVISTFVPHCQDGQNECDGCDSTQACPDD